MHYSRKPSERTWHLGCFPQTEWRVERTIINTAERGIFLALAVQASLGAAHGFSCPTACGIFVP